MTGGYNKMHKIKGMCTKMAKNINRKVKKKSEDKTGGLIRKEVLPTVTNLIRIIHFKMLGTSENFVWERFTFLQNKTSCFIKFHEVKK